MSYEGYEQNLCERGHYSVWYEEYEEIDEVPCPYCFCGSSLVWRNPVDETNCDGFGYIPPELFTHVAPGKLAIPDRKLQTYRVEDRLFFVHNDKEVVFPSYKIAEYEMDVCHGRGNTYAQEPCLHSCSKV